MSATSQVTSILACQIKPLTEPKFVQTAEWPDIYMSASMRATFNRIKSYLPSQRQDHYFEFNESLNQMNSYTPQKFISPAKGTFIP